MTTVFQISILKLDKIFIVLIFLLSFFLLPEWSNIKNKKENLKKK